MQIACREYTHSRNLTTSRPRGWIRSNPKVGPVLDVKLCPHEGRYCIDIMIDSLFTDRTVSWVRIVNDINKHVTETSEEIPIENVDLFISTGKPVAKAKPRPFDHSCFEVSKFMTGALRHEASIPREIEGAVNFDDLIEKLKVKFADTLQWTVSIGVNSLAKRRRKEEEVSKLLESFFIHWNPVLCKTIYCYRMTSQSTSTTSGTPTRCTPLFRVNWSQEEKAKPRIAPYRHTWRSHHNTVFWCNLKLAQKKGLRFYQTRSHVITLSDTLSAICIDKVVCMKTREEL